MQSRGFCCGGTPHLVWRLGNPHLQLQRVRDTRFQNAAIPQQPKAFCVFNEE